MAKSNGTKGVGIQPLGDRVLVRPDTDNDTKSAGGIYIPDSARTEKPERGTVVAVGPGKRGDDNEIIPVGVRIGDKVMFSKYGFDEVKVDGQEYFIISESSILAVFSK
jgi:chaperonin GroES